MWSKKKNNNQLQAPCVFNMENKRVVDYHYNIEICPIIILALYLCS